MLELNLVRNDVVETDEPLSSDKFTTIVQNSLSLTVVGRECALWKW